MPSLVSTKMEVLKLFRRLVLMRTPTPPDLVLFLYSQASLFYQYLGLIERPGCGIIYKVWFLFQSVILTNMQSCVFLLEFLLKGYRPSLPYIMKSGVADICHNKKTFIS